MTASPVGTDPGTVSREVERLCALGNFDQASAVLEAKGVSLAAWSLGFECLARSLLAAKDFQRCEDLISAAAAKKADRQAIDRVGLELAEARGEPDAVLTLSERLFVRRPQDRSVALAHADRLKSLGRQDEAARVEALNQLHMTHGIDQLDPWTEPVDGPARQPGVDLYLDLLERTVCNWIYADAWILPNKVNPYDEKRRLVGRDIPAQGHSMIGRRRLRHLRRIAEEALEANIPGDFLEAGVWRGGACILMRGVLAAHEVNDRKVIVADSFEGLPAPDPRYAADALTEFDFHLRPELAVDLETVRRNFDRYGLLDEQVMFLKGFFRDTLQTLPPGPLAILRLDGDLYSSTMDTLAQLYDRVSPGGYIVIDDYGAVIDARRATLDFRHDRGIQEPMRAVDGDAVFWRKA